MRIILTDSHSCHLQNHLVQINYDEGHDYQERKRNRMCHERLRAKDVPRSKLVNEEKKKPHLLKLVTLQIYDTLIALLAERLAQNDGWLCIILHFHITDT